MTKVFAKPESFYDTFVRKGGAAPADTHYCPGCGHGTAHKLLAEAVDDLGVADRSVLISPVGCSVFAYYYFNMGNVQAAHGRAPAVGTGVKRARPESIVVTYQGDGDLAAIGLNNIVQAANRGELMTVLFVNNAIYGMTGGQMAPTTLPGQRTTTTPSGRDPDNEGYPLSMCEMLATLRAPVYIERVSFATPKHVMRARRAIRSALECQIQGLGFSFVEILAQCPTGWKMSSIDSLEWIENTLTEEFPLGVYRDERKERTPRHPPVPDLDAAVVADAVAADALGTLDAAGPNRNGGSKNGTRAHAPMRAKIAGFGGQGVLYLGEMLAEAGIAEGLQVSWLPSYGPEMRGGTAHCHVTVSNDPIGSPLVERSTHLIALNGPSLERFQDEVEPGGTILYNASLIDSPPTRSDVTALPVRATEIASDLGSERVANMVMLGALLGSTGWPRVESLLDDLNARSTEKTKAIVALNRRAVLAGVEALTSTSSA